MATRTQDESLSMLGYWVGKYGLSEALAQYYPNLSAADPVIRTALGQYMVAEIALRQRIKELEDQAPT